MKADLPPLVLLVEDSDDDAFFFQRAMQKTGLPCSLRRVANGRMAIDTIAQALQSTLPRAQLPILVFLDLKMPVTSGFEVLQWLKGAGINPPLYVIVLSGSNDHADRLRAKTLGASDYMVKPICPDVLKSRLQMVMDPSQSIFQKDGAS